LYGDASMFESILDKDSVEIVEVPQLGIEICFGAEILLFGFVEWKMLKQLRRVRAKPGVDFVYLFSSSLSLLI